MNKLIIASAKNNKIQPWILALEPLYGVVFFDNIERVMLESESSKDDILLILDASLLTEEFHLALICQNFYKVLIVNENHSSKQIIQYIYDGAWGYSEYAVNKQLIVRTVESILNNEVWLERQLIPQLLRGRIAREKQEEEELSPEILSILTLREVEVVKLIYNGEDNTSISQILNISNRTVKAHLSAVYRKLNVSNRFQLIVFLKNLHVGQLSNVDDFLEGN